MMELLNNAPKPSRMIAPARLAGRLGKRDTIERTKKSKGITVPKNNVVAIRDKRGRYLRGMPGGPGRPLGSRNRLREDFLVDMHAAWLEHRPEVINRLIAERPEVFLTAMLKITQVHRVELARPEELDRPSSKEEALRRLEQKLGARGAENARGFPGQNREIRAA